MGRKQVLAEFYAITNGDMSGNLTSIVSDCQQFDHFQYIVDWNGAAPVGVFSVQQSTDGKIWEDLDFGVLMVPVLNIGTHTILVEKITFKYFRLVYTWTSGTGVLNAKYSASTVGA